MKRQGLSQSDIAELFGVTRQAISYHKVTYNGQKTPREIALEHFPWKVPARLNQCAPYMRMRDHAEFMATGGEGMEPWKLKRLRGFYTKLRRYDLVVEYDPVLPPMPGVSNRGGFAYRHRCEDDGDLIIRVNDHTTMTPEGAELWVFPSRDP